MKYRIGMAILTGLMAVSAGARDQFGIGVIVGEPTGLSVKYWLDEDHAIDGGAAWSFWDGDGFQLHGDYLWHNYDLLGADRGSDKVPVHYGVGARLKFRDGGRKHDDDAVFGIRIPVGVSYLFDDKPFDIFAELVPIVDLAPDFELNFSVAVGLRFYLK